MRRDELLAQVEARYRALRMPEWPDPHADLNEPRPEEYSRVTDPQRYRVVHARGRVWTDVLREAPDVDVETLTPGPGGVYRSPDRFDRGVRLTSRRPGTLPLLLLEQDASLDDGDRSIAVLRVSLTQPDVVLATLPDCGCDACDSGSHDLLTAVDDAVGPVVTGPFVVVRDRTWWAHWHPEGGSSHRMGPRGPRHAALMAVCQRLAAGEDVRLPGDAEALVGRSWFS